ncbi:MAG: helix-turn-helix domain-containing protein [Prevotella sp.]|nr:helix-turn-helix domain-containing protein [Prevotella sp.]
MKRAKELLSSTSLPLEDIATQSGFNSLSSFRRYFTKSMGTTPQAFRKE